jgi:hypothetical protein
MFFHLRIEIFRVNLGIGSSHSLDSPHKLVEIMDAETDPTPLVR